MGERKEHEFLLDRSPAIHEPPRMEVHGRWTYQVDDVGQRVRRLTVRNEPSPISAPRDEPRFRGGIEQRNGEANNPVQGPQWFARVRPPRTCSTADAGMMSGAVLEAEARIARVREGSFPPFFPLYRAVSSACFYLSGDRPRSARKAAAEFIIIDSYFFGR